MQTIGYLENKIRLFFALENIKKPQKVAYFGSFFFSAASTAQNSPELHFRFINSFIQPSLVGSLVSSFILILVGAHLIYPDFNTKSCRPRPTNVDCRPLENFLTGTKKKARI